MNHCTINEGIPGKIPVEMPENISEETLGESSLRIRVIAEGISDGFSEKKNSGAIFVRIPEKNPGEVPK